MQHEVEERSPLRRGMKIEEVGKMAAAVLSDLSSGVTGQTVYVDVGYNIVGSDSSRLRQGVSRWLSSPFPQLSDNYAYLVIDDASKECAVVDCAEADKVIAAAKAHRREDRRGADDALARRSFRRQQRHRVEGAGN